MFSFLKKNKEGQLYSPIVGKCIPLSQVPDKMFAEKLLGEGVGLVYDSDVVCAPCDGEIVMVAATKHAFGIKSRFGAEILVHIGLNTVELNGEGFEVLVSVGQKVKAHDPIIRIDRQFMAEKDMNLITPMIITNMDEVDVTVISDGQVDLTTVVCDIKKK